MLAPYERVLALARREAALIGAGEWDEVSSLASERDAAYAALPPSPPSAARPLLEEALACVRANAAAIAAAMEATRGDLSRLGRGRRMLSGYAAGTPTARFVDRRS